MQAATKLACAVEPTAVAIQQIVAVNDPALKSAAAIASVICDAVKASASQGAKAQMRIYHNFKLMTPPPVSIDGVIVNFV